MLLGCLSTISLYSMEEGINEPVLKKIKTEGIQEQGIQEESIQYFQPKTLKELCALMYIEKFILKKNWSIERFERIKYIPQELKEYIKYIIKYYRDSLGRNFLFKAETAENIKLLIDIVCCNPDFSRDIFGNSPINWATQNGRNEVVRELLKHISEDLPNYYGQTAFNNLIASKNTDLAKEIMDTEDLLEFNGKFAKISDSHSDPLFVAAKYNPQMIKKILDRYRQENYNNLAFYCSQALLLACKYQPSEVKELLDSGADINFFNYKRETPLMKAAERNSEILQLLIDSGANLDQRSIKGFTALRYAINGGDLKAVEILLKSGVQVDLSDNAGNTPLFEACDTFPESVKLLISAGANVNAANIGGQTPIMIASADNPEIIEILIKNGAHINSADNEGWTPLMYASKYQSRSIPILLKQNNININLRDNQGHTALQIAAASGNSDAVVFLINAKAECQPHDVDYLIKQARVKTPEVFGNIKEYLMETLGILIN